MTTTQIVILVVIVAIVALVLIARGAGPRVTQIETRADSVKNDEDSGA
jgi:preprotein translocase subunit SecG